MSTSMSMSTILNPDRTEFAEKVLSFEAMCTFPETEDEPAERQNWTGQIQLHMERDGLAEATICGRHSSFDVLVGRKRFGLFLCIPDWKVGLDLAPLGDVNYNRALLMDSGAMQLIDASTVAYGLRAMQSVLDHRKGGDV